MVQSAAALAQPNLFLLGEPTYSDEVPDPIPIKDQCRYGSCWIYGSVARLERRLQACTGRYVPLSEPYLILQSLRERVQSALDHPGFIIKAGGKAPIADALVRDHGLVPQSVWHPRHPFEQLPLAQRLLYFLNARVAQYQLARLKVKDQPAAVARLRAAAQTDLHDYLATFIGDPPARFAFGGREHTPQSFAREYLGASPMKLVGWAPPSEDLTELRHELKDAPTPAEEAAADFDADKLVPLTLRRVSWPRLERAVIAAIRAGRTVRLSYEHAREFRDETHGIYSLRAFPAPAGFAVPSRAYRKLTGMESPRHLVEIVGVDVSPATGRVNRYKLRNSWGEDSGDKGYWHMYSDYFQAFARYVFVEEPLAGPPGGGT
jgi:bleomycin hydrolase